MNFRMLGYLLGAILLIEAALFLFPLAVALLFGENPLPFLISFGVTGAVAIPFVACKPKNTRIFAKEGFVCVAAGWILLSLFGALPFVLSGAIPNYVDALFETVSGFTTTGASLLPTVETLPKGVLFWRSFTHWIGGMGVLVFMLAILPSAGGQSMHLLRAEVPGPTKGGKLVPKLRQTAMILYGIYLFLTLVQAAALCIAGFPLYDAVVTAFSTAGTGGFGVRDGSIAAYANPAAEWIIAVFMLLFGLNFNLYFFLLIRHFGSVLRNEELRVYLILVLLSTGVIAWNTWGMVGGGIRNAFFQVTSIMSTTGFVTVNYDTWPTLSKAILVALMLCGGCAGSTAGGLKVSRVMILFKCMTREIRHLRRPRSINTVHMDGEVVEESNVRGATNYLALYVALIVAGTLLIAADPLTGAAAGNSLETSLTSVLTCLNNVGPGLGKVIGATGNFSPFSPFSKLLLSLLMLVGRLEIMPMVIFFAPATWKKAVTRPR